MRSIRPEDLIDLERVDVADFLAAQNISLKPAELERIRSLIGRNPSLVELHIFNVMWSEHCSYKSSKALLKKYLPTDAPYVVLGPGEDAGIIRFFQNDGGTHCLVMAHESHNHPSQVLPVEGAATGIGGIVRDVYCMGADVIGVLDPLRFGDPEGPNAKRVQGIVNGVVEGIAQYGNALGVPNYGGETYFDSSFDDNCLVNVIAIGVVEEASIVRSRAPDAAGQTTHDIILIGKPTDASGFGGAAFASERLSGDEAEERQEAVQIPDPFLKRVLVEATKVVLREARGAGVGIGFKDLGAGGISCAVSEMAHAGGVGAVVDLDKVNTSSDTLPAEVIACSETQERYAMIVPTTYSERVCKVYNEDFEMPHLYVGAGARVIGETTREKRFQLIHHDQVVCDSAIDAITTGIEYEREAKRRESPRRVVKVEERPPVKQALLNLLSSYNVSDKSILFQHYDSEVQGRAVLRPGEADAAVAVLIPGEVVGVATGIGSNSVLGTLDPYTGAVWAVCEAVRNVACVGARAMAVTDCLNYGDPEDPGVFWDFVEGVRGIGEACRNLKVFDDNGYGLPVISGNVSFYNQSGAGWPIAPTPIVACAGRVENVGVSRGLGFKKIGSKIVLLGALHERLGGSEYARHYPTNAAIPGTPDFARESGMIRALLDGFESGVVLAAHDISHGGLLVTVVEMMLGSKPFDVGCSIDVGDSIRGESPVASYLFSEYGGIVVEVDPASWPDYREVVERNGAVWSELGETTDVPSLCLRAADERMEVSMEEIHRTNRLEGKCNRLFA